MKDPSTLYLVCGKMAAGKSTLAKKLSEEKHVILLSEDELLAALYPDEINDVPNYIHRSRRLKTALEPVMINVLKQGLSMVLDFPANTVSQRKWLIDLAKHSHANYELHFIDRSDEECKIQLLKRVEEQPERHATDTIDMFDTLRPYFEPPTEEEGLNVICYTTE